MATGNKRHLAFAREYARVRNMAEMGRRHGISRERVRQILKAAGVDLSQARSTGQKNRSTGV